MPQKTVLVPMLKIAQGQGNTETEANMVIKDKVMVIKDKFMVIKDRVTVNVMARINGMTKDMEKWWSVDWVWYKLLDVELY